MARRWPLMVAGLFGPLGAVGVCVVLGVVADPLWFIGVLFVPMFLPVLVYSSLLCRNWPTGIRIDGSGITIGAVRSRAGGRRAPTVAFQAWGVHSCPWAGVRAVRLVTEPGELGRLKASPLYATLNNRWGGRKGMTHSMLGVLTPPFMRAALVIDVDPAMTDSPRIRPSRYYSNGKNGRMSVQLRPGRGATWIVPTRHPDRLGEVIAHDLPELWPPTPAA